MENSLAIPLFLFKKKDNLLQDHNINKHNCNRLIKDNVLILINIKNWKLSIMLKRKSN